MTWKPIRKYEGRYEVAEDGSVRSLVTNRILRQSRFNSKGYKRVALYRDGLPTEHLVHRLVAKHHIGRPAMKVAYVNHKDLNKLNNHVSNLEWVTPSGNIQHYYNSKKNESD